MHDGGIYRDLQRCMQQPCNEDYGRIAAVSGYRGDRMLCGGRDRVDPWAELPLIAVIRGAFIVPATLIVSAIAYLARLIPCADQPNIVPR